MRNTFLRNDTAKHCRSIRKALKETHGAQVRFWPFIAYIVIFWVAIFLCAVCHSEQCNDPVLTPQLKKACVEFEKACEQIKCKVSVR